MLDSIATVAALVPAIGIVLVMLWCLRIVRESWRAKLGETFGNGFDHASAGIVGITGRAETRVSQRGRVFVRGELWTARSNESLQAGEKVKVVGLDGLVLLVEGLNNAGAKDA